ncbi:MAG: hypothetical protein ACE5KI_00325, partial [Dehalococcoidia bacterium]
AGQHHQRRAPVGAVELALRTGAVIVPGFTARYDHYRYAFYFEPPIEIARGRSKADSVQRTLARIVSLMERYIRRFPGQWMVYTPLWGGYANGTVRSNMLASGRSCAPDLTSTEESDSEPDKIAEYVATSPRG